MRNTTRRFMRNVMPFFTVALTVFCMIGCGAAPQIYGVQLEPFNQPADNSIPFDDQEIEAIGANTSAKSRLKLLLVREGFKRSSSNQNNYAVKTAQVRKPSHPYLKK